MDKDKQLEFLRKLQELKAKGIKAEDYTSSLDKDVNIVRGLPDSPEQVRKIHTGTEKINTKGLAPVISGADFTDKISKLRALKAAGKKVAGILPFAGAGLAALSGDPAMAAEEALMDLPGAEALRSESVGESPEEEKQMLAEDAARKNYEESPARKNRLENLKMLLHHYRKD